jgi:PAS domain-containing protein
VSAVFGPRRDLLQALDESSDCAFLVGPQQRILSWNQAGEELLGRPRSEALGSQCHDLIAGRVAGQQWCRPRCPVWRSVC